MVEFVNFYLIPALVLGSVYALGAIGVSLLFAIMRFAHFAHGDIMSLGAYFALIFVASFDWPPILALPFAIAMGIAAAIAVDRLFYKPFRTSKPIILVIASFGVALMIRSLIQVIWGVDNIGYVQGIQLPIAVLAPLRILERHVYIVVLAVALMVGLHYFLKYTRTGKAMRAMSDDADLARITGIDTEKVVIWTWVIGAGLAAAGGVLLGMDSELKPQMGWDMLLPIFAAAILGGLGQPYGAIAGGLIIGAMEELSTYPWIGDEPFVSPDYKTAVAFGAMVLTLIFRPQGIFRGRLL
jgi:branched-subunit amino acid ABC-type transport system permease component